MRMKNNFGSKAECTGPQTSQSAGKEQSKHFSAILGRRYGLPPSGTETRIRNCLVNNVVVVAAGVVAGLKRVGGIRNHRNPPPPWQGSVDVLYALDAIGVRFVCKTRSWRASLGGQKRGHPLGHLPEGGKMGKKKGDGPIIQWAKADTTDRTNRERISTHQPGTPSCAALLVFI